MRRATLALLAGLVLSACAAIPDSGPVERVVAASSRTHSTVRYEPARPRSGASPLAVAEGYLDSMLAYPEATAIVQTFLTVQAAEDWESAAGFTVYSNAVPRLRSYAGKRAQVEVRLREVMSLDPSGRVTLAPKETTRILQLASVAGQWRIDNPVPGYLVSQSFARDYIRSFPLWYFDESGQRLVPELVHAVVSEQLPLTLLHRLAGGPRGSTLRTYLPSKDRLRIRFAGSLAEVDIRRPADGSEDKIAAQLLSTLRGVPGLDGVRILIDGIPDGKAHPIDAVVGFGPGAQASRMYALRGGRVVEVARQVKPMRGPWGKSAHGAVDIAVGESSVAAVVRGRSKVVVGGRSGGELRTYPGSRFVRPVWDPSGRLWLVDNPAGARIRVVDGVGAVDVDTGGLGEVQSFAVSPDGSRYAAALGAGADVQIVVGAVVHDVAGLPRGLGAPMPVSRGMAGERQVGWASQTRVEFIAGIADSSQLYTVGLDGVDRAGGAGASELAGGVFGWAGPPTDGADRWALDRRGRIWRLSSGAAWERLTGRAGGVVHGLSSGR
jgi:hypothetical protein